MHCLNCGNRLEPGDRHRRCPAAKHYGTPAVSLSPGAQEVMQAKRLRDQREDDLRAGLETAVRSVRARQRRRIRNQYRAKAALIDQRRRKLRASKKSLEYRACPVACSGSLSNKEWTFSKLTMHSAGAPAELPLKPRVFTAIHATSAVPSSPSGRGFVWKPANSSFRLSAHVAIASMNSGAERRACAGRARHVASDVYADARLRCRLSALRSLRTPLATVQPSLSRNNSGVGPRHA